MNGNAFIILYGFVTAGAAVYLKEIEQNFLPAVVLFYSFILVMLFYMIFSLRRLNTLPQKIRANFSKLVMLNIMTSITWVAYFYAMHLLAPAVVAAYFLGTFPLATILFKYRQYTHRKAFLTELAVALLIVPCLIPLTSLSWQICLPIIAAVAGSASAILAYNLSRAHFATTEVLALRFILAFIVMSGLVLTLQLPLALSSNDMLQIGLVATLTLILPAYLLQRGLTLSDPIRVAFLCQFIPIFTYGFELLSQQAELSVKRLSLMSCLTLMLILVTSLQKRRRISQESSRLVSLPAEQ